MFVSAEIDWLISPPSNAVQFSLSGNSPVALSQIVALVIDNGRSGADVSFVFPDTGFELVVAARNQGVFPVFTNALMFYAVSPGAIQGDVTVLQIMNSMPPPIPITASMAQNHASLTSIPPQTNGTYGVVGPGINGTINTMSLSIDATAGASPGTFQLTLQDGSGAVLWADIISIAANSTQNIPINLTGLALRFRNGLSLIVSSSTVTGGAIVINVYYSTP